MKLFENVLIARIHNVDSKEISAVDQDTYQQRFIEFMREHLV